MKYYLSLCVIAQNEVLYLDEWVKYHQALGIDHIYLYENDSTDKTFEVSSSYYPFITTEKIHGTQQQGPAYMRCLEKHREDTRWLGFIDVDEFIVPKNDSLKQILKDYEAFPAVCFHWYLFGSSGKKVYEPRPVVERFTMREREVNRHVKSFVDPMRTKRIVTAHKFAHELYGKAVDENFISIDDLDSIPLNGTVNRVQINHYVTKSLEESWERRARPGASRADVAEVRKMPEFFHAHDVNEVEDFLARDLWRKIP